MSFEYSVQLYSVRDSLMQDPYGVLGRLRAMGYTGLEGFGEFTFTPSDVNYGLADIGLKIVGYHTSWDKVQEDKLKATISYFKSINNKYVIIPSLPVELTSTIDDWKKMADKFNALSKLLQGEGMVLGYHNHEIEFKEIGGEIPFNVFFDNTDPSIILQMDCGNAMHGGADVMALMKKYPGRSASVHLKPYSKTGGFSPVIGEDDIDWKEFLHWCRDNGGTEHYIVEYEDEKTHPQMVGVDLCIKALKEMEASGRI